MSRSRFTVVAVILWLSAMGWLVRREYLTPQSDIMLDAGLSIPPGATFFAVSLGDRQVGTASITADTLLDGVRVVTRYDLDLPYADGPRHVVTVTNAEYTRDLRLTRFSRRSSGDQPPAVVEGSVEGDSLLTLRIGAPEEAPEQVANQALSGAIVLPSAVPLRVALTGELEVGAEIETTVLDPTTLTLRTERASILADTVFVVPDSADLDAVNDRWIPATYDTVTAFRFDHVVHGLPQTTWVDQSGYVIWSSTPLGFTLERSAFELVSENYRRAGRRTDGADPGLPVLGLATDRSPKVERMTTVLEGGPQPDDSASWAALSLDTPWQKSMGDTVISSSRSEFGDGTIIMDYRLPWDEEEAWQSLDDGPYDGTDPRVAAQARRIVGGERRVIAAYTSLVEWIHREIALIPPGEPTGAWHVLDSRTGDASGQAALFVAMARSAGIPARTVAGFVHQNGRYHYSAWAEVWLTEWVAVDPTLGQAWPDGSHIRLTTGGLALPGGLPERIGRLRPRLVSLEEAS